MSWDQLLPNTGVTNSSLQPDLGNRWQQASLAQVSKYRQQVFKLWNKNSQELERK
jgi:hypothetical protein